MGWGLSITNSANVHVLGAMLYGWYFDNYRQDCIQAHSCQRNLMRARGNDGSVAVLNLVGIGAASLVDSGGVGAVATVSATENLVGTGNPWMCAIAGWTG